MSRALLCCGRVDAVDVARLGRLVGETCWEGLGAVKRVGAAVPRNPGKSREKWKFRAKVVYGVKVLPRWEVTQDPLIPSMSHQVSEATCTEVPFANIVRRSGLRPPDLLP